MIMRPFPILLDRFRRHLSTPVDAASVGLFRIGFGALLFWETYRFFQKGWIHYYFVRPQFFFSYPGLEWIAPWPGAGMYWHFAIIGTAALFVMLGLFYRAAAIVFTCSFVYMFLIDQTHYLNHFYLVSLLGFQFCFLNAHAAYSLDKHYQRTSARGLPRWQLYVLRFQIGIVYFYGGIAKLNPDWLAGEPMRTWLAASAPWVPSWLGLGFSYGGLLLDLFAIPLLLLPSTKVLAVAALVAFHLFNARFFNLGIFPWLMLWAIPLFFKPDWPRRKRRVDEPRLSATHSTIALPTLLGLGLYVALQVLVPLRHYAYSQDVRWTGEGEHFSWLMKLSHIESDLLFYEVHNGARKRLSHEGFLTSKQETEMKGHPQMILQFAKFLAARTRDPDVEIHATLLASLNGRPIQPRLNPNTNLATLNRKELSQHILPLQERTH